MRWVALKVFWVLLCATVALMIATAQEASSVAGDREGVVRHMHEHVRSVDLIRNAIIAGDLDAVREPAEWLATHKPIDGLPGNWGPYVDTLRDNAARVTRAKNLVAAAYATSRIATACADCHEASGVSIPYRAIAEPPEEREDFATHMQRHRWAADRMWEGIYQPSNRAWHAGVDMLLDVPLEPHDMAPFPDNETRELRRMALEVHLVGSRGMVTDAQEQRAQLYSEYLSLCVDCHMALERGPER